MEFQINQIFTKEEGYPPEAAVWCNERGDCYIEEFEGGYRIVKVPDSTPEELEKQKLEQAKTDRAEAVRKLTVTVDGMVFDADEIAQSRMTRAITAADTAGLNNTVWVLADNTVATVTKAQLQQALALAMQEMGKLWTKPYEEPTQPLAKVGI